MNTKDHHLRYPIGNFQPAETYTPQYLQNRIAVLRDLPEKLKAAVAPLDDEQLETAYRHGGWTIRQVVHHIADSHMNCMVRIKLTLTEDTPTVKPYNESDWALLPDYQMPLESSLQMITGIHAHMALLYETMSAADMERAFYHPESKQTSTLKNILDFYAWHSQHHLAHINQAIALIK